jgi:hypothetical protein
MIVKFFSAAATATIGKETLEVRSTDYTRKVQEWTKSRNMHAVELKLPTTASLLFRNAMCSSFIIDDNTRPAAYSSAAFYHV